MSKWKTRFDYQISLNKKNPLWPDLKKSWFAVIQACCFEYTPPVGIFFLSLRLEEEETLKYVVSVGPRVEKFNIVSKNH